MVHYTYWIIDTINQMYYHGVHSSTHPHDINIYCGSSKALSAAIEKHGIEHFIKRVERTFHTRDLANLWEAKVHKRIDVANNPRFYNIVNANSLVCTLGKVSVRDQLGNTFMVSVDDSRYLSGELVGVRSGITKNTWSEQHKQQQSRIMQGNTRSQYRTDQSFAQFSKKMTGISNPKFKGIICIDNNEFINISDASAYYMKSHCTIKRWLASGKASYRELTASEKAMYYQIIIDGVPYQNASQASRNLNIHQNTVYNRLQSNAWPTYIDKRLAT